MSALSRAIASTGLLKKHPDLLKRSAGKKAAHVEGADYHHHHHTAHNQTWYSGVAVMFAGPVTITSLSKNVEYNRGMLEYVPFFLSGETPLNGIKPAATATVVRPHTYDLVLVGDKPSSEYQPEDKKHDDHYPHDGREHNYYKQDGPGHDGYYPHEGHHHPRR